MEVFGFGALCVVLDESGRLVHNRAKQRRLRPRGRRRRQEHVDGPGLVQQRLGLVLGGAWAREATAEQAEELALGLPRLVDACWRQALQNFWQDHAGAEEVPRRCIQRDAAVREAFVAAVLFDSLLAARRQEHEGLMRHEAVAVLGGEEAASRRRPDTGQLEKQGVALEGELPGVAAGVGVGAPVAAVLRKRLRGRQRSGGVRPADQGSGQRALRHVLAGIAQDRVNGDCTDRALVVDVALIELPQGVGQPLPRGLDLGDALAQCRPPPQRALGLAGDLPRRLQPPLGVCEARAQLPEALRGERRAAAAELSGDSPKLQGHQVGEEEVRVEAPLRRGGGGELSRPVGHHLARDFQLHGKPAAHRRRGTALEAEPDVVVQAAGIVERQRRRERLLELHSRRRAHAQRALPGAAQQRPEAAGEDLGQHLAAVDVVVAVGEVLALVRVVVRAEGRDARVGGAAGVPERFAEGVARGAGGQARGFLVDERDPVAPGAALDGGVFAIREQQRRDVDVLATGAGRRLPRELALHGPAGEAEGRLEGGPATGRVGRR
mmetsp:Transcript_23981/g.69354  ORF Transcript_23981/g.69354 Transcript_23981/m.69354 type:complete len:550 (-) Transcript_23981:671-2320(-)